ncbi:unnamed protein product [Lampetra planeri]
MTRGDDYAGNSWALPDAAGRSWIAGRWGYAGRCRRGVRERQSLCGRRRRRRCAAMEARQGAAAARDERDGRGARDDTRRSGGGGGDGASSSSRARRELLLDCVVRWAVKVTGVPRILKQADIVRCVGVAAAAVRGLGSAEARGDLAR